VTGDTRHRDGGEAGSTRGAGASGDDAGQAYLRQTRHSRDHLVGGRMDWMHQPDWYKTYPDTARIPLPDLALDDSGVFDALARRRSLRAYGPEPLALGELSALLWAAAGVTERRDGFAFRTAPSAGGLYPVEHYVVANDVEGLERGLYHYDVLGRALERLVVADLRAPLANAALGQRVCADAQAVFVWTAVLERSRWKYGERFARYVLLDAGHIAGNVALAATALGLGTCQIAAFFDEEAAAIVGVDPDLEPVVYMSTVGRSPDG
jgi:SagB-type dehydrogenase family enzyme